MASVAFLIAAWCLFGALAPEVKGQNYASLEEFCYAECGQFIPGAQPVIEQPVVEQQPQIFEDCSPNDSSPAAVEACVNAVRVDPMRFQPYAECDLSRYRPVPPLYHDDGAVKISCEIHAEYMAGKNPDVPSRTGRSWSLGHHEFKDRLFHNGFTGHRWAENVAVDRKRDGALGVVMNWMCSSGHAHHIMDCRYDYFGTATICPSHLGGEWCFYCQDFGAVHSSNCRYL